MTKKGISITGEAKFDFDVEMMIDPEYETRDYQSVFDVEIEPGKN